MYGKQLKHYVLHVLYIPCSIDHYQIMQYSYRYSLLVHKYRRTILTSSLYVSIIGFRVLLVYISS